jgi:hypothetical protein
LLSARGKPAFLDRAGFAGFLVTFFGAAGLVLPPFAVFWPLGTPFFGLAPFFEGAFVGATVAPCSATLAAVLVSALVMVGFLRIAPGWRTTIHRSGRSERQGKNEFFRND